MSLFFPSCRADVRHQHTPIRIGWQVPWATQGQVVQVLKHTNVLALNGLQAEFSGFNYGGPLNEAALSNKLDAIFTADQPAATLLARGGNWTIVARLMYNRVAIYVPPDSPIRTLSDLKGKRIGIPFGAAAQRDALKAIAEAGLDPKRDITATNLDIYEQNAIVQSGTSASWRNIDALVGFDPTPAIFEYRGLARMLHVGTVVSVVMMSNKYLSQNPDASVRFLMTFVEAWYYYARHQSEANAWFCEESRLQFDPHILNVAASVEPNVKATTLGDVRPTFNQRDLLVLDQAASFVQSQGLAPVGFVIREHIDQNYISHALQQLTAKRYDATRILPLVATQTKELTRQCS